MNEICTGAYKYALLPLHFTYESVDGTATKRKCCVMCIFFLIEDLLSKALRKRGNVSNSAYRLLSPEQWSSVPQRCRYTPQSLSI